MTKTNIDRAVGVAAIILAVTLGGGWAAAVIISALHEQPITSEGLAFLNNLGQTLATGLVAFLGYKVGETATAARLNAQHDVENVATGGVDAATAAPPTLRRSSTVTPDSDNDT